MLYEAPLDPLRDRFARMLEKLRNNITDEKIKQALKKNKRFHFTLLIMTIAITLECFDVTTTMPIIDKMYETVSKFGYVAVTAITIGAGGEIKRWMLTELQVPFRRSINKVYTSIATVLLIVSVYPSSYGPFALGFWCRMIALGFSFVPFFERCSTSYSGFFNTHQLLMLFMIVPPVVFIGQFLQECDSFWVVTRIASIEAFIASNAIFEEKEKQNDELKGQMEIEMALQDEIWRNVHGIYRRRVPSQAPAHVPRRRNSRV